MSGAGGVRSALRPWRSLRQCWSIVGSGHWVSDMRTRACANKRPLARQRKTTASHTRQRRQKIAAQGRRRIGRAFVCCEAENFAIKASRVLSAEVMTLWDCDSRLPPAGIVAS